MKQQMLSYLSTITDEIFSISNYILKNGEESYKETSTSSFLSNILKNHGFKITNNFLDIPNSFYAEFGNEHPRICFTCDYDVSKEDGDLLAHHISSTISIGAALLLANAIESSGHGSVVVIGCSGELKGGSKAIMVKEGAFEDIDIVMSPCPHVVTAESASSMASLPIEINYESIENFYKTKGYYSPLSASLFTLNGLDTIINSFEEECYINSISMNSPVTPHISQIRCSITFYIKARKMSVLKELENKIHEFVRYTSKLMNVKSDIHYHEMPSDELKTNATISRLFSHNLKESGLIKIDPPRDTHLSLSLGSVSHIVPTIRPFISICEDSSINPYSNEFVKATTSEYTKENVLKAIEAFAYTGLDIIEREDLLRESLLELNSENEKSDCRNNG